MYTLKTITLYSNRRAKTTKCDFFYFQFIDGRLSKLNAGRGFSDVFEEEITAGGFSGGTELI